jgi:hypothetical protein
VIINVLVRASLLIGYQTRPDLSEDEFSELKHNITACGVFVPIEYDDQENV